MSKSEKFCSQCGAINDFDAIFCNNCGKRFEQNKQQPQITRDTSPLETAQARQTSYQPEASTGSYYQGNKYQSQTDYIDTPENTFQGALQFVKDPERAAPTLMMDPEAPSGIMIVLIHTLLVGLVSYMLITNEVFFNELTQNSQFQQSLDESGLDIESVAIVAAFFAGLYVLILWALGSYIMGLFVKGGIPKQSPMHYNFGHAMRQQTAYRSIVYIPIQLLLLVVILSDSVSLYTTLNFYLNIVGSFISAYLVVKSFGKNIGYQGIGVYIFAFLIILPKIIV